jgi:hypothetical protein
MEEIFLIIILWPLLSKYDMSIFYVTLLRHRVSPSPSYSTVRNYTQYVRICALVCMILGARITAVRRLLPIINENDLSYL